MQTKVLFFAYIKFILTIYSKKVLKKKTVFFYKSIMSYICKCGVIFLKKSASPIPLLTVNLRSVLFINKSSFLLMSLNNTMIVLSSLTHLQIVASLELLYYCPIFVIITIFSFSQTCSTWICPCSFINIYCICNTFNFGRSSCC